MATAGSGIGTTERVAQVTLAEWNKRVSEETVRKLIILALLMKKGLITFGHSGGQVRWPVRKDEHGVSGFPDMTEITFARKNTKTNAYLPWRGYYAQDTITLREKLENGGPEAIVRIFENREKLIREGAQRSIAGEFYVDGDSAAGVAGEKFHGLETMMSIGAQTATDIVATSHDDTYASLSTGLGTVSNVAATHQLARTWTPNVINTVYNPGTGIQAWKDYAVNYIREMLIRGSYGNGPDDNMDLVILTRSAYTDLLNLLDDKERICVERGQGAALISMGFSSVVEVDGCPITWDLACPTTDADTFVVNGYALNTSKMELRVLSPKGQKTLFASKITFNDSYQADNFFLWLLGNLVFESPRHFGKFVEATA